MSMEDRPNPTGPIPPTRRDHVVLVDETDNPLGVAPKLAAHENGGRLHRAFSVFVFDSRGRILLQRRAAGKYHFGRLWTNACCSHPQPGESVPSAARERLREEFGFDAPLVPAFTFVYRAADPATGLTEHEFDHVFYARFDGTPRPDPAEIADWKWVEESDLRADISAHPDRYTPWFRIALDRVQKDRARPSGS